MKKKNIESFKMNKTQSAFSLLALILIPLLSIVFYAKQYQQVPPNTYLFLQQILNEKSKDIETSVIKTKEDIKALASNPETITAFKNLPNKEAADFFKALEEKNYYSNLILIKTKGEVIYTTQPTANVKPGTLLNKENNEFLWQLVNTAATVLSITLSDFEYNNATKQLSAFFAVPVFEAETLLGVMVVEMNMNAIYRFINDYQNLGDTGEYVLASQKQDKVIIQNPTRLDSNAMRGKINMGDPFATGLQSAVQGNRGFGEIFDFTEQKVFAAWCYLPNAQLGFEVKISVTEAYQKTTALRNILIIGNLVFIIFILSFVYYLLQRNYHRGVQHWIIKRKTLLLQSGCLSLCVLFGVVCVYFIIQYGMIRVQSKNEFKKQLDFQLSHAVDQINQLVGELQTITNTMAQDLSLGKLKKEDIELRLKRTLIEYPFVFGAAVMVDPQTYSERDKAQTMLFYREHDQIVPGTLEKFNDSFFKSSIDPNGQWSEPFNILQDEVSVVFYAHPFDEPLQQGNISSGRVMIFLDLNQLPNFIPALGFGKYGYGFLSDLNGSLIYYPLFPYVQEGKTIFQVAAERNEPLLRNFGLKASSSEKGEISVADNDENNESHLFFQRIPGPDWVFAFSAVEEKSLSETYALQKILKWIIFSALFSIIFGLLFVTELGSLNIKYLTHASITISCLFIVGLILLWRVIYLEPNVALKNSTMVLDQLSVDALVEENALNEQALKSIIKIPTGVFIRSIQMDETDFVKISGYCWQKYPEGVQIPKEMYFPKANHQEFRVIHQSLNDHEQIIVWDFSANIWQPRKFWQFPFDLQIIQLELEAQNLTSKLFFVPDFAAYQLMNPNRLPGVDESLAKAHLIKKSYFSYQKQSLPISFDPASKTSTLDDMKLNFDMVVQRDVIGAFMLYLLPLLVILGCMFMVLITSSGLNLDGIISSYTVLLFGLIITHRELRTKLFAETVVYLEYFFIIAYLVLFLLIFNAYLVFSKQGSTLIRYHHNIVAKDLYWPILFCAWFLVTLIVFYQ